MEPNRKKKSGHVGTRTCVAGLSQQTYYALDHHASPKKDASSPEQSNTVFRCHCLNTMSSTSELEMGSYI